MLLTVRYIDADALHLLAPAGVADLDFELVGAAEIRRRAIEADEDRHVRSEALPPIGRLQRTAFDDDTAVRGRGDEFDRRQRARCAIRADVGIDAETSIVAGRCVELTLDNIRLRTNAK
jgi:hypothetical protein